MENPTTLIDSHAHLDFRQYDGDREATIARARSAGVAGIVNVGTDLGSSRASVALAERYPFIWATVGIHPHDARLLGATELDELRALAAHPKVVAIGEIGLDYYRDLSPRPEQRRAFAAQLELASELGMPVVIHSRDAHEDVEQALKGFDGTVVLHSYSAGPARLEKAIAAGHYVSISGPVTFRKADELREVAASAPLDRMLLETDCPYLAPEPRRGRRNEPAYVRYVARAVARARRSSSDAVARATAENARRVLGLGR
jgi:TatD DNase family protein